MTAIVAGQGLGLGNTSLGLLGNQGVLGKASQGRSGEQVYVNAATGNLVVQQQDERLIGRGPDIGVVRTYNSLATVDGDNNDNWRLGLSRKVTLSGSLNASGSTVTRTNEDGTESVYVLTNGVYINKDGAGSFDKIVYVSASNTWTWTDGNSRVQESYDRANGGRLTKVTDPDGNALTIAYNGNGLVNLVTDANGEKTYIDYDTATGKTANITQIRTVDSANATRTRVRYAYDTANRLSTVTVDLSPADNAITDGRTYITTYTYDSASKRVASIAQTDGSRAEFTYDASGRVQQVRDVRGTDIRATTFDYSVAGQTRITDALGGVTQINYQTDQTAAGQNTNQVLSIVAPAVAGVSQTTSFTYDADGNVASVTDARGNTTVYGYDANGNRTYERDAAGNVIERSFGAANELLNETRYLTPDPDGAGAQLPGAPLTTRYVYDTKQHLRFVVSAEGRITENRYNASGQLTATLQYLSGVYDLTGLSTTATLTETQLTTRTGALSKSQVLRVDYTYDTRGNVSSKTRYAAVDATTGEGVVDGTQSTTNYVYDQHGELLQSIEARGVATTGVAGDYVTTYAYDGLNRLVMQTDALGNMTINGYLDATNQVLFQQPNGQMSLGTYDPAGNLLSMVRYNDSGPATTTYAYDSLGRQVKTTDATGLASYKLYDEASRLVGEVDTEGALTEYLYNANNQLTGTRQYASRLSSMSLAALSWNTASWNALQTLASVRPAPTGLDRNTLRLYDSAGRLAKTVDAGGSVTEYFYDGASRLTDTLAYATELSSTQWQNIATLVSQHTELLPTDVNVTVAANAAADRRTRQFYSADGLLLGTLDAEGYLTEYSYDNAGQRTQALRYATQTASANWVSGTLATLRPATSPNDQKTLSLYNLQGELEGTVDPEGYLTEYQYDVAGNNVAQIRYKTPIVYTAGNGVVASRPNIPTAEDQKTLRQYDALGRVVQEEQQPSGLITSYTYNAAGNITQIVRGVGAAGTEQRTTQRRYDLLGRLTGELNERGAAALAAMATPTQAQIDDIWGRYGTLYTYDAAGRRTSAVSPDGVDAVGNKTLYYYDGEGRLTHTINALGEVIEYGYSTFGQQVSQKRYGTRIATATLATLTGGLNTTLGSTVSSLANASLDSITSVSYDGRGMVSSQVDALGNANTTNYDAFGQAVQRTDKIDASAVTATMFAYDRRGLLQSTAEDVGPGGLNYVTQTLYDAFGRATQVTDANGSITQRSYDRLGRTVSTTDALNLVRRSTYDAFGRVLTQTDALGNATTTVYDSANRQFTVTTPEGITKVTVLNRHGQTVSVSDGRGNTTTYAYGSDGQLESTTAPVVGASTSTYDAAGHLLTTVDARRTTVQYTYDAADRVLTRTVDPVTLNPAGLNLTTRYSYDALGRVATLTDANNTVTQNSYDAKGQLIEVAVDPTGLNLRTAYTYDARGKTLTVTEGAGTAQAKVTQYVYDARGRRTGEVIDPGVGKLNLATTYTYDADDNVVAKTDGLNNVTRYVYDANNRRVYTVDATGAVQKSEYDNEGRVVRSTAYKNRISLTSPTVLPAAVSAADVAARLVTSTSDQATRYAYDKDGRLRFSIDAAQAVTELTYDASGNVIQRTRYANALVGSLALGQAPAVLTAAGTAPYVLADVSKDQTERTVYDAANRATVDIDAANYVTERAFDANGNVTRVTRYAGMLQGTFTANVAPTFASAAQTSGSWVVTGTSDQTTRTVYDRANRATFVIDPEGYVTRSTYDAVGRLTQSTRFTSQLVGIFTTNTAPQVLTSTPVNGSGSWVVTNTSPIAGDASTSTTYDAAGRWTARKDALGFITARSYDAASRVTDETVASGTSDAATTHYTYDAAGRVIDEIRGYNQAEASTTRYAYDGANRVTDETLAYGKAEATTTHYDYDAAGHKTQKTEGYGQSESALTQTEYDAFGNAVKVIDPRGNAGYFYFDARNRNVLSVDPEGYAVATRYNAFGTVDSITRYANKVVGTLTTATAPVVVASASGSLYILASSASDQVTTLVHDQRNLQTKITDAQGISETLTYDAFGNKKTYVNKVGGTFTYSYDRKNQLVIEVLPVTSTNTSLAQVSVVNAYTYDARGNKTKVTEARDLPEQRITNYTYDKLGRVVKRTGDAITTYANGVSTAGVVPTETRSYDGRGNLIEVVDPAGGRTLSYYDRLNRKSAELSPTGTLTRWVYNAAGDQVTQQVFADPVVLPTTAGGTAPAPVNVSKLRETVYAYDRLHRLTSTTVAAVQLGTSDSTGNYNPVVADVVTRRVYDRAGNVVQEIDANNNKTYSYYDTLGRRVLKVDALRYATTWEYDASGDITKETRYANPVAGTLTLSTSLAPAAVLASVSADALNDRVSVFGYDKMNRLASEQKLNVAVSSVMSDGSLTTTTTTTSTTYTYNGLGLVLTKTDATGTTTFTYNRLGSQTQQKGASFTDYSGTTTSRTTDTEYNGLGLVRRSIERGTNNTVETDDHITSNFYGKNGLLTSQSDPAGTTTYSYDAGGRITSKSRTRVDADGVSITDTTDYVYDLAGRQTQQIVKSTTGGVTTQLQTLETRYNAYGEIIAKGTNGGWQEYAEYDKMGRLMRSNSGSGVTKVYFYDANGNATLTVDSAGGDLKSVAYNLVTQQSGANLTISAYDARNQLTDTFSPTLTQIEHIQTAQAILNEQQSQVVNTQVSLTSAAGLGSAGAALPPAAGLASIANTATVSATLADSYVGVSNKNVPSYASVQHTLTVTKPDTSAWGGGGLRVSISIPPTPELGLGGYYGDFQLTASVGNQAIVFGEGVTGGISSQLLTGYNQTLGTGANLSARAYSYTLFKRLDSGGEVRLGTYSGNTATPTISTNGGTTSGSITSSTTMGAKQILFQPPAAGYSSALSKVVLLSRPAGSTGGWTITDAQPLPGSSAFAVDWNGWARQDYAYRFVAIGANGNVVDIESGTLTLSDAAPVKTVQLPEPIGGDGHVFMDTAGNLHFYDQGADITALEVSGAWGTQTLAPAAGRGPGWFVLSPSGLGLNSTYGYTVKAKNAAGVVVHQGTGSFTTGQANSIVEPTRTATASLFDVGQDVGRWVPISGSVNVNNNAFYTAHGMVTSYSVKRSLSITIPNTDILGAGSIRIAASIDSLTLNGSTLSPGVSIAQNILNGQPSFSYDWGSGSGFSTYYSNLPNIDPVYFRCHLWKQVGTSEVDLGSFVISIPFSINLVSPTINVSVGPVIASFSVPVNAQTPTTAEMVVQYRLRGTNDKWVVMPLVSSLPGMPAATGRYLWNTSLLARGDYEFRQMALDSSGSVLSTGTGILHLQDTGATISETADTMGGAGRAFMDSNGWLNLTEQAVSASTVTVRYRPKGTASVWSNAFTLGATDKYRPGWFYFDPTTRGMAANTAYEYEAVVKDSAGNELNHIAGSFITGDANSVSAPQAYKGAPVIVHFTNVAPETAATLRLSYRKSGTADPLTVVTVPRVGAGAFDWDTSALKVATTQNYDISFDALGSDGRIVARAHATLTLGDATGAAINGYTSDALPSLIKLNVPAGNSVAATATQMVLQYRKTGTQTYSTTTLVRTDGAQPFVFDASSAIPPGTAGSLDYTYTLKDANGVTLVSAADGSVIQVSGQAVLSAVDGADGVAAPVTDTTATNYKIRRRQVVNAFGETIKEIDANDRVTDFTYNTLGRLIQKQDPETNVTLANGFVKRARPTTKYYYDALGRLVGTDDANNNRKTMLLSAELSSGQLDEQGNAEALVLKEFHADGGVVENGYDVFGLMRYTRNELLQQTDYTYDGADRLVKVERAARSGGSYNAKRATDTYAYDAVGNRISHTDTPDGVAQYTDKTYYDALGRVTKAISAQNRTTTMDYAWDASLKGAGGATVGGWTKTTRDALTGTKQNPADSSTDTTPPVISAMVDAVNLFGQTVAHTDLGGHQYSYSYNMAGWLISQSSNAGQNISYEYYANGYIKKSIDASTGAWTEYGYDKVGNRTYEAYSRVVNGNRVYEQNAQISYDELNRVSRIDDLRADIRYEYDAQSNRRLVWSVYQDGVYGYESTQTYWYTYDSMNRFLVTRGSLAARASTEAGAGTIVASNFDGVQVGYDKAGQRTSAIYGRDGHREDYTYTSDGLLENTYLNPTSASAPGVLRASRTNDLMGRVVGYTEYDTNGASVTRSRTLTFDNDNRQTGQTETYQGATTNTTNTLLDDGTLSRVTSTTSGVTTTTYYAYEWWDSAKQSRITEQAYNPALKMNNNKWKPGVSHYTYDVNGHVLGAIDEIGLKSFNYISNAQGQVMLREQAGNGVVQQTHRYYYAEGRAVGDVGNDGDDKQDYAAQLADTSRPSNNYTERQKAYKNFRPVSSADFDQNYQPITASYPGTAPGSYTVQAGDNLYSIAASQWGDSSLWYLIAEANGLSAASNLTAGQTLSIPNKVTNVHNTSATSAVYDPGATMGDTSPTIPDAPPPPKAHHKGCGGIGFILTLVVAVVVTVYTAGTVAPLLGAPTAAGGTWSTGLGVLTGGGGAGVTAAGVGAAAIGGAVGSIASQGVAMAVGIQDKFSWKGVAMSALGAGASAGVGGYLNTVPTSAVSETVKQSVSWGGVALRAAGTSVVTQGVGSLLGLSSFSWKAVAAAAAGAQVSSALDGTRWMQGLNSVSSVAGGTVRGLVSGGIQAGIFGTKPNWGSIAAQSFGSALGDSFTQSKVNAEDQRMREAVDSSLAEEMQRTESLRSGSEQIAEQLARRSLDRGLAASVLSTAADADGLTPERLEAMLAHTEGVDAARMMAGLASAGGDDGLRGFTRDMAGKYADQAANGLAFAGALRYAGGADSSPEMARVADALQLTSDGARAIVLGDTSGLSTDQQSALGKLFANAGIVASPAAGGWLGSSTASIGVLGSVAGELASYVGAVSPPAGAALGGVAMLATAVDQLPEIKSVLGKLSGLVDTNRLLELGGRALPGIDNNIVRKPLQEAMEAVLKVSNRFEDRLVGMLERSPNGLLRAAGIGAKQLLDGAKATGYFGEQIASFVLDHSGLFEAGSVRAMQNPSMHGIDIMAKALTGAQTGRWVGFEVKASSQGNVSASSYSERQQRGAEWFIRDSLEKAGRGNAPWWRGDGDRRDFAQQVLKQKGPFYGVAIEFNKVNTTSPSVVIRDWPAGAGKR